MILFVSVSGFAENLLHCEEPLPKCDYVYNGVHCGYDCKYVYDNVYCASQSQGTCSYVYDGVYCGVNCQYVYDGVYCADTGKASKAKPSKPGN
jgi:hypothetical protein